MKAIPIKNSLTGEPGKAKYNNNMEILVIEATCVPFIIRQEEHAQINQMFLQRVCKAILQNRQPA